MKIASLLLLSGTLLFGVACKKQDREKAAPLPEKQHNDGGISIQGTSIRTLTYLYSYNSNWVAGVGATDVAKLTDLVFSFFVPDAAGNFVLDVPTLQTAVNNARTKNPNVRLFFAIGGGNPSPNLVNLIKPANRAGFITKIVAMLNNSSLHLSGVDVDLENDLINADYAGFVNDLQIALHNNNKLMSAALVRWKTQASITNTTLGKFDFINIMAYDSTGYWGGAGQHSSLNFAKTDFEYFNTTRGIPAAKLFLGLPFYGYGFGPGFPATDAGSARTYSQIVNSYAGAENTDSWTIPGSGTIYYNGKATIISKVQYAIGKGAGGVMIWQVAQDVPTTDTRSLLRTIYNTIP
jgi:chitinase